MREQVLLILQIVAGFKTLHSPVQHFPVLIALSLPMLFFCGVDLVSRKPLELGNFCWLLVRGHNDLSDGPYQSATVLLGTFLFYSLVNLFYYAQDPGHSTRSSWTLWWWPTNHPLCLDQLVFIKVDFHFFQSLHFPAFLPLPCSYQPS